MIAKGTPHRDGAILARYLVTGKERERAELWGLRGFPCTGIVAAFRTVHVMAAATKCIAPFFHVSVRNPDGDSLDKAQWELVADSIERMLGLTDQPRALAVHSAEDTGHSHVHIAWSRICPETLTAKPLPFFKQRLKRVCRELEERFGLTAVPNERHSSIRFAPTRSEDEQARRLGVDVHATRESIRNCFERSDCGRSFREALAEDGLALARGDRRDFLVVDRAGGVHAVGKRIVGVSAAQIRDRLAGLPREALPTLEELRSASATLNQLTSPCSVTAKPIPALTRQTDHTRNGHSPKCREKGRAAGTKPSVESVFIGRSSVAGPDLESAKAPPIHVPSAARDAIDESAGQSSPDITEQSAPVQVLRINECVPELAPKLAPPGNKTTGFAAQLKSQFRALVKQLTTRTPAPRARKKRREESGAFTAAAKWLVRHAARVPSLHFLDSSWEPFTWLSLWEHNDAVNLTDHQHCDSSTTRHGPHL